MVQEVEDGRIFVCHNGPEAVHVYDRDGKFINAGAPTCTAPPTAWTC